MTDFGPCCICETRKFVRNVLCLKQKSPILGRGWGCLECGLPSDGAVAVLCDKCFDLFREKKVALKFACRGYPASDGRVLFETLTGSHDHDMSKHPEEAARDN